MGESDGVSLDWVCCQASGNERRPVPILLLAALLLFPGSALASDTDGVTEQRNPDGSRLRLTEQIDPAGDRRVFRIEASSSASAPYTTLLQRSQLLSDYPRGGGRLEDMDGDGQLEFVERLSCGAGPNCQYRIFKLIPAQQRAYQLFEGGFFLFRPIAGRLVTSSRSSCCSWTHQIYRTPVTPHGITEQDLLYSLELKAPIDGASTPVCRISRPRGKGWEQATIRSPELLKLCEGYGKNVVINPALQSDER